MIWRRSAPSTQKAERPRGFDDFELKLGDVMRGERATLSKSLLDVQRELRIKASYIAAIEGCDLAAFDTPSFIAGYVRSYARYLGLDPDDTFERFCRESGFQPQHGPVGATARPQRRMGETGDAFVNPHMPFVPKPESFWSKIELRAIGSLMLLTAMAGGIGYGGWTVLQEVQRVQLAPVDQAPGVMAELDPLESASATQRVAENDAAPDAPAPEQLDRMYRPQALDVPVLIARDGPIAAIDPSTTGLLAGTEPRIDVPVVAQMQVPQMQGPMPAGQVMPAPVDTRLAMTPPVDGQVRTIGENAPEVEILAVRPSWVRIKAADGSTLLEKVMDAGERFALPRLEEPPVMRIGESGAIYFAVNGVAHGPAGKRGEVTRNVILSPEALDGKFGVASVSSDDDLAKMVAVADAGAVLPPVPGVE